MRHKAAAAGMKTENGEIKCLLAHAHNTWLSSWLLLQWWLWEGGGGVYFELLSTSILILPLSGPTQQYSRSDEAYNTFNWKPGIKWSTNQPTNCSCCCSTEAFYRTLSVAPGPQPWKCVTVFEGSSDMKVAPTSGNPTVRPELHKVYTRFQAALSEDPAILGNWDDYDDGHSGTSIQMYTRKHAELWIRTNSACLMLLN